MNKDELGVSDVFFEPAYGLILIRLNLKNLSINPEHASFIDLDVNQPLNFEIKFHIQRITTAPDSVEDLTH